MLPSINIHINIQLFLYSLEIGKLLHSRSQKTEFLTFKKVLKLKILFEKCLLKMSPILVPVLNLTDKSLTASEANQQEVSSNNSLMLDTRTSSCGEVGKMQCLSVKESHGRKLGTYLVPDFMHVKIRSRKAMLGQPGLSAQYDGTSHLGMGTGLLFMFLLDTIKNSLFS